MPPTVSGIDHLLAQPEKYLTGKTVSLVVNHTSLTGDGRHSIEHFKSHSAFTLHTLFAPEHGLYGTAQDMDPWAPGVLMSIPKHNPVLKQSASAAIG